MPAAKKNSPVVRQCCRHEADLALAIGLKLYSPTRSEQRRAQLAAIKTLYAGDALLGATPFPAKRKHGKRMLWQWDEIVAWAENNLIISDNQRSFELVPHIQETLATPIQPSPSERMAILARYPEDYRTRLQGLYEKWLKPNDKENKALTKSERDELLAAGLVKEMRPVSSNGGAQGPIDLPDYCSQSEFARLMSQLYNAFVSPQMISVAITKEGMPGKMSNGSIKMSLAAPWWEANKVIKAAESQGNLYQLAQSADAQRKIDEGRRARLEADELERSTSNKWVELALVETYMEGRGLKDCDATDRLIEDKTGLRKIVHELLLEFKIETELVEKIMARLAEAFRAANDNLKKQFLASLTDFNQKLDESRNQT